MKIMADKRKSDASPSVKVPEPSDDELVTLARSGNEGAFSKLYERHSKFVARLAYRFFMRREQVEEIIQESFIKAYFALGDYQGGNQKSFVAWLGRISLHTCYDALRRQKRRNERNLGDLTEDETAYLHLQLRDSSANGNIEGTAITRDLANKLLSRLKPEDRLILILLKLEDLSIAEIAGLTGWTEAKIKMRSYRAQHGLRKILKKFL
jgi:RNA polymerase sigma-70 factor (ECF subfamily)